MFNKKNVATVTLTSLTALFIATSAFADIDVGPYLGGGLGWGTIGSKTYNGINNENTNGGVSGRVFAGLTFTPNLGLEAGFTKFTDVNYSANNNIISEKLKIQSYAVDMVGKVTLPLENNFSLFGKVGGAYLNENASATITNISTGASASGNATHDAILPTFGAGLGYNINKNVTADVSWMRIQKVGNTNLNSTDTAMFNLSYHF
jgi:OOP family OmpA-OmpF porin